MVAGCAAIVGIFFILSISFAASKKWQVALAVCPLMIIPIFYLLGGPISKTMSASVSLESWMIHVIINTLGLVLSCLILGLISLKIKYVSIRIFFLSITGIYSVVLFFILAFDIVSPFIM